MEKVKTLAAGIEVGESVPSQAPIINSSTPKQCAKRSNNEDDSAALPAKSPRIEETGPSMNYYQLLPTTVVNPPQHNETNTPISSQRKMQPSQECPGNNPTNLAKMFREISERITPLWTRDAANPVGLLYNALMKFPVKLSFEYADRSEVVQGSRKREVKPQWECSLFIGNVFVTQVVRTNKNEGKKQSCIDAASMLRDGNLIVKKMPRTINGQSVVRLELLKTQPREVKSSKMSEVKRTNPLAGLVIMEHQKEVNPICTIMNSCQFSKLTVSFDFKDLTANMAGSGYIPKHVCKTVINDQVVGVAIHETVKEAKRLSAEKALGRLRKTCPVIKMNKEIEGALTKQSLIGTKTKMNEELPDSNIGNKMMKKMGWTGGGLGKEGNIGRAKPVEVDERFGRAGLGVGRPPGKDEIDMKTAQEIIKNYTLSHDRDDLVFSAELNNEERKLLHQAANKFGLKSVSYGKGDGRYLVVKKMRSANDVMKHLVQTGGTSSRYELVLPPGQQY